SKPRELELGVSGGQFARIGFQRVGIAGPELVEHGLTPAGVVDDHEAPRLTQADRWRKTCYFDQAFKSSRRQRLGAKAPHVTAPDEQIAQAQTKCIAERRHLAQGSDPAFRNDAAASKIRTASPLSSAPCPSQVCPPLSCTHH